jgi:hypothetical protein
MAFTTARVSQGSLLVGGDRLFLYTTRRCFGNANRDRGRVIGEATVKGPLRRRSIPVRIAAHDYTHDCELELHLLTQFSQGVVLADLVPQLHVFPVPQNWSFLLRRVLLPLPAEDAALIDAILRPLAGPPDDAIDGYLTARTAAG